MFAPLGTFLCRVCKTELYDAKKTRVENNMFVFEEFCEDNLHIHCPQCLTQIGFTQKNLHCVYSFRLTYFST